MRAKDIVARTGLAIAIATVADLALLALARAGGVSMVVPHGPEKIKQVMGASDVLIANVIGLGLGGLFFLALAKLTRAPERWFRVGAGLVFVLMLLPIFQDIDNPTRLVLFVMHVVSAGALLYALGRRRPARVGVVAQSQGG
jgi:hypothetical protein